MTKLKVKWTGWNTSNKYDVQVEQNIQETWKSTKKKKTNTSENILKTAEVLWLGNIHKRKPKSRCSNSLATKEKQSKIIPYYSHLLEWPVSMGRM